MRTLVESLKRLYSAGRLTTEKLDDLLLEGKIMEAEYAYIRNDPITA